MGANKKKPKRWALAGGFVAGALGLLASLTSVLDYLGVNLESKESLRARVSEETVEKEPVVKPVESNIASSQVGYSELQIEKALESQTRPNRAVSQETEPPSLSSFPREAELSRVESSRTISETGISVSVAFQALDGEDFATLTISQLGGAPLTEAILGPGKTFQVQGRKGRLFAIDIIQADFTNSVLRIAIREE